MGEIDTRIDPRVGTVLAGRYRLDARVDAGGMATVYRATDAVLGREVAVKIMHPALAADPTFSERFRGEAQNAARLGHPNICAVYDYGEAGQDLFIVMELVDGTTLRSLLDRFGRLDTNTARHVARGIASALDHAHAKGFIHRDVKPENVLLTPDGQVKVVDFGIAKALGPQAANLTTDRPIGTVAYVAPEQITSTNVDARADVYALGATTYEMITGRPPFTGDTPQAVAAARLRQAPLNPGVSHDVDAAVQKATAPDPKDRFATPGEFANALGEGATPSFLAAASTSSSITSTAPVPLPPMAAAPVEVLPFQTRFSRRKRRRTRTAIAVILVLALAGAVGWAVMPRPTTVPDLRGQTLEEAEAVLNREGLKVGDLNSTFHDVAPAGTIVGSDPDPGTAVEDGIDVTLLVSKGVQLFDVPDVKGKPVDEAKVLMQQAGFSLSVGTEAHHDTVPKGAVASFDPNRKEARKGTAFTAVVSKGPVLVAVPNVQGKTPGQAKTAFEAAGFVYASREDFSDTIETGAVIGSEPGSGQMAPKGSTITAVVSKGPRPFPMPDLVGMTRAAAKEKARTLGLVIRNEYPVPGSGKPKGTVQGQNPPAGTNVRPGTGIDIYFSQ
jgi:serine/threonine-protein kinase